uniref:Uncharacterized protein n=1 Tax=Cacopsylla melanoneura TaxID=428564 RepID=A0A8D9EMT1_9HEMI
MTSTHTKCLRQSGRFSKTHQSDETTTTDIKSSLRHMGKKNYLEQDDDNSSDYCPLPKRRLRTSSSTVNNISERKLSLRNKDNSPKSKSSVNLNSGSSDVIKSPSPKKKYTKRNLACTTDRKLRNQTLNESECCNVDIESTEIKSEPIQLSPVKAKRGSRVRRLTNNSNCNNDSQLEHRSSKLKTQGNSEVSSTRNSMKVKPKVIDHFNQSEEINIESSSASNLPKKSNEPKKSNNVTVHSSIPSRKRSTLSQKHTDNNQLKLNGISYSNRTSISHHGKLCRKTKKTTIYHDSNGWILSKGHYSGDIDFWDGSQFDISNKKNVKSQQEIEIPSFREKKYTPLYKIEGKYSMYCTVYS